MKRPPRLRLEPRPSRIACGMIACCGAASAMLVLSSRLPWWVTVCALGAVAGVAARTFWRCGGRGVPASIVVADNRRITVAWRDGTSTDAEILGDSYVGAWLTCVTWQADGAPWWRPARTLLFLPDTVSAEDFRQLRVLLRYGVPDARADRNGVEAAGGSCEVRMGEAVAPVLTIETPADVWIKMDRGEIDRPKAFMQGLYRAKGDMKVLMRLPQLFGRPRK